MTGFLEQLFGVEFLRPSLLLLVLPSFLLIAIGAARRVSPLLSLFVRLVAFLLLIIALAGPHQTREVTGREFTVLFDLSSSISPKGRSALLDRLALFLDSARASSPDESVVHITAFGRNSATARFPLSSRSSVDDVERVLRSLQDSVDSGETDIAAAIQAISTQTEGSPVLVLSDGFETTGDARLAARAATAKGVRFYPLVPSESFFRDEELSISLLDAPITVNAGEVGEVRASVKNSFSSARKGTVEIWLNDKRLSRQELEIGPHEERLVTVKTPVIEGGLHRIRAVVLPEVGTEKSERYRWMSVKSRSKILLLSGANEDATVLRDLIRLGGFALEDIVADGRSRIPVSFENYSVVILNNVAARQLPQRFLDELKNFVSNGGGLLLLGGERSFGLGGYIDTPLEEISPLRFVPPTTTKRRLNTALVLLIDKSRSMSFQGKMANAKAAAVSAVQSLKDDDFVAVISFDADPFVVLPLKPLPEARSMLSDRLRHLTPVGKTILHPAIGLAQRTLQRANASRKHIILLTDGEFPYEENSLILSAVQRLRNDGITLSSVAVGIEADVPLLKTLAGYGKGAFYHTIDPTRLPEIFVQDIKVSTGEKTMREQEEFRIALGPTGVTTVAIERYPPLRGFVETLPKRGSRLELITKKGETAFPILASWEFGAGRVAAFTSDANGRWSQPWLGWNDFPRFWLQALESVTVRSGRKGENIDFDLRFAIDGKRILLDLAVFDDNLATQAAPRVSAKVTEPAGGQKRVVFQPVKRGRFHGSIDNGRPGDYRIEVEYGATRLPPLAITIPGDAFGERPGRGLNVSLLSDIAHLSGGLVNPSVSQVSIQGRKVAEQEHLFPPFIVAAFVLLIIEAFLRELRLSAMLAFLFRSQGTPRLGAGKKSTAEREGKRGRSRQPQTMPTL